MRHRTLVVAIVLGALASRAAADPITHIKSPSSVHTDGGTDLRLPPGYFLDEPTWKDRDAEFRRLQDLETRLNAENASLKRAAGTPSGWVLITGATAVVAFCVGYAYAKK